MFTDLSKNTPEELRTLFKLLSSAQVEHSNYLEWSQWMEVVNQSRKDSEFELENSLPFNQEQK